MRLAFLAPLLLLTSCATQPEAVWYKNGGDFTVDSGQCRAQAFSVPGGTLQRTVLVYEACLEGKGWTLRSR